MLIKTYRLRLYVLYLIPAFLMCGLVTRLYFVQVLNRPFYEKYAARQHFEKYSLIPMRGKIYDSEGHELAGSVVLDQAYLNLKLLEGQPGKQVDEEKRTKILTKLAQGLAQVLNDPTMRYDELLRRLKGEVIKHPSIGKDITEEKKLAIKAELAKLSKDGVPENLVEFVPDTKRRYSRGGLAPHVVGYTGWNSKTNSTVGQEGVERTYEEELRGRQEEYVARRTAANKPMEPADPELLESTFGHSVKLTINESIQAVTQNVLQQGVEKSISDAGVAICYAVKTGEILAIASYPTFDLNNLRTSSEQRVNRAVSHAIEPGSVMKIITFTSLFDDRKIEPFDVINCEGGVWQMPNGRVVRDSHSMGVSTVAEVFQHSSNIGTIKAARVYDNATFYDHLVKFGFGSRTGVDLPSESPGVLAHYKDWSGLSMSSLPMGYEIQLTAVQVVGAVGAIANKGNYMQPHVVKEILDHNGNTVQKIEPKFLRSVADPAACRKVIDLMEQVVEKGTAKPAKLEGYRVGGKTGTTKKLINGRYENAYIASFCGIAPIEDPEVCIYVYVDNPKGDKVYGGSVAAPIFREICRETMKVLRVPQHRPTMPAEEFKKKLEQVRNQIDGRVPMEMVNEVAEADDSEVSPGVVPQLKNLTLREAVARAAAVGLMVVPSGSGTVISQSPGANETIEGERVVHVVLENSSQTISRQLNEVKEFLDMQKNDDTILSTTVAALPATSVPLALRVDGREVELPLSGDGAQLASIQQRARTRYTEDSAAAGPLPDLDEFANGKIPSDAAKNWEQFKKQYNEVEKQKSLAKPSRAPKEVGEQDGQSASGSRAASGPVPEIDGTDDFDPTRESPAPISIETPQKPKASSAAAREQGFERGMSLYNL
jgi:cell division protein FtsI/penicillin-binding protein 2